MKCPKCGAYNVDNAEFCNLCQHPFQKEGLDVDEASSNDPLSEEQAEDTAQQQHKIPGFRFKVKKKPESEAKEEDVETTEEQQGKNSLGIGKWLLAAILSTAIAVPAVIFIPKDQINANLPLGKMFLAVFMLAFISGSDGILKMDRRSVLVGCSLGLSAGCLAFISIFLSLFLVRLAPNFYTLYAMGSEVLSLCVFLAVAVGLYWSLERLSPGKIAGLVLAMAVIFFALSVLVLRWINPLPVVAFLAWPVGYYLMRWMGKNSL